MDVNIGPFWNKKQLEPPIVASLKIECSSAEKTSASLAEILEKIISLLNDQEFLHNDAALISRLLFRIKRTFRRDKGYKGLQKVKRHLSSYLSLDLLSVITHIRNTAYGSYGPSKEVLEWGLLNIKRFAVLFHRLEGICQETGYFMHNHMKTGHYWSLALLLFSCLGRIWTISRYLTCQACEWYMKLRPFLTVLPSSERWLPSDYELPSDLKSWLGNPEYIEMPSSENPESLTLTLPFNEDFGEIISRAGSSSNVNESKVKSEMEIEILFKKCEDVAAFIQNEQKWRKNGSEKSKTKHLNETEWQYIKKFLKKTFVELMAINDEKRLDKALKETEKKAHKLVNRK